MRLLCVFVVVFVDDRCLLLVSLLLLLWFMMVVIISIVTSRVSIAVSFLSWWGGCDCSDLVVVLAVVSCALAVVVFCFWVPRTDLTQTTGAICSTTKAPKRLGFVSQR